jgi:hypothetical protein
MLRDPLTFGRRFDQNPHPGATRENRAQPIPRGQDAAIDDFAMRRHNPDLAFSFVQIDGTILHGWSPSLRLKSACRYVERKLPRHLGDQPVHPICGNLAFSSEISKCLWKSFCDFRTHVISIAASISFPTAREARARRRPDPGAPRDRHSYGLLRGRFSGRS